MKKELFVIAGANGSGKSTLARELLLSHENFSELSHISSDAKPNAV